MCERTWTLPPSSGWWLSRGLLSSASGRGPLWTSASRLATGGRTCYTRNTMTGKSNADELLAESAARYASCHTYRDIGEQECMLLGRFLPVHGHRSRLHFSTDFVRSAHLHFAFHEVEPSSGIPPPHTRVVATNTEVHYSSRAQTQTFPHSALPEILRRVAGESGRTSIMVPSLLMPGLESRHSILPLPAFIRGKEHIDGNPCIVIGNTPTKEPAQVVVWLQVHSLLLLRLEEQVEVTEASLAAVAQQIGVNTTDVLHSQYFMGLPDTGLLHDMWMIRGLSSTIRTIWTPTMVQTADEPRSGAS